MSSRHSHGKSSTLLSELQFRRPVGYSSLMAFSAWFARDCSWPMAGSPSDHRVVNHPITGSLYYQWSAR